MEARHLLVSALAATAVAGCAGDGDGEEVELVLRERATAAAPVTVEGFATVTRLEGGEVEPEWSNTVVRPRTRQDLGRVRVPPGRYRLRVEARDPLGEDAPLFGCERELEVPEGTGPRQVITALKGGGCTIAFR